MITDDDLVQRFLDQELSAEERIHFLARVGRDSALRERVIALEQLVLGASRLPRPAVPAAFVADVMDRIEPAWPVWRTLAHAFLAPRQLRWNLASAAAVACVALLAVWGVVTAGPARRSARPPSTPSVEGTPTSAGSTGMAASTTVLVRLVVLQPGARTVQVAGDFNGWNPARAPLEQTANGAWTVMLPLEPGRYEYQFVVDGDEWIADPFAAEQSDDGFGSRNAVLEVRSPQANREAL